MYIPFQRDDLKIVNGRSSAEQYFMYPNSRVLLMDSNCDRFYIKETDASGMAKISTYDFTKVEDVPEKNNYVTREEFEELMKKYELITEQQHQQQQSARQPTKFQRICSFNNS